MTKPASKSAYRVMMEGQRRKARTPVIRGQKTAIRNGKCGAPRRSKDGTSKVCLMKAGWGTDHPGQGNCKYHGGASPTHTAAAAKDEAVLMGAPMDINPLDALVWCIRITAGEVQFCTEQLQMLKKEDWVQKTIIGEQIHLWAKERQKAVDRLAGFSKTAISLGIAEKAVRLAEQYGTALSRYTKGLLDDIMPFLTEEGRELLPGIVRKHILLMQGISSERTQAERRLESRAIEAAVVEESD